MNGEERLDRIEMVDLRKPTSRRDAIKWSLAALAGAGISALAPATAYAGTGAMMYGDDNDAANSETTLTSAANAGLLTIGSIKTGSTLTLENIYENSGSGLLARRGHVLSATHTATASGDAGVFTNNGTGAALAARSTNGYGVVVRGGKAHIRLEPGSAAGAPAAGAHVLGEIYADSAGVLWVCTVAGTPGTWAAVLRSGANAADVSVNALSTAGAATVAGPAVFNGGATMKGAAIDGTLNMTRSGRKRVSKGKSSVSVSVPSGVSTTANILCTLQNTAGSGVYVRYAKRTGATTFKIYLNKKATTKTAHVGWMILG